jgi:hypothetical protein
VVSLANEYDLMPPKGARRLGRFAGHSLPGDPYSHLRSIHKCTLVLRSFPALGHPLQHPAARPVQEREFVNEWRERYRKPVVLDEIAYEGNIQHGLGQTSAVRS